MDQSVVINFFSAHQWIIPVFIAWSLVWKGVALWKAARNQSLPWFVAILIINTLGILEIVYIFLFSKKNIFPKEMTGEGERADKKII